jgi:hypothetical protein
VASGWPGAGFAQRCGLAPSIVPRTAKVAEGKPRCPARNAWPAASSAFSFASGHAEAGGPQGRPSGQYRKSVIKTERKDASWEDLFLGHEVGSADAADLGKIRQFFTTLLLAALYLSAIGALLHAYGPVAALPALSEKFVWLLAVSHGTYLAYKAAPHTKDAGK